MYINNVLNKLYYVGIYDRTHQLLPNVEGISPYLIIKP